MRFRHTLGITVLALYMPPVFAVSNEALMNQMFGVVPAAMIQFCSSAAPELRPQLDETAKAFEARLMRAATPFFERLRAERPIEEAGPKQEQLEEVRQKIIEGLRTVDAPKYCAALIQKLQVADVEAMAAETEARYRRYMSGAKENAQQGIN